MGSAVTLSASTAADNPPRKYRPTIVLLAPQNRQESMEGSDARQEQKQGKE